LGPAEAACAERASGHRAARALASMRRPLKTQFSALRASFRQQWQPQGGIDDTLIDALSLAHTNSLAWSARLHVLSTTEAKQEVRGRTRSGKWSPPRAEAAAWIEQAAQMAERFHRLFLRSLRALQDYRRGPAPRVAIGTAGQVNIGSEQVNVTAVPPVTTEP
jgi:hypothetical protein